MTSYWLQSENKIFCRVFFSSEGGHLSRDAMRNTRDLSTIVLSFYLDSIRQDEFDQVFVLDFDENRLNKKTKFRARQILFICSQIYVSKVVNEYHNPKILLHKVDSTG